MKIVFHGANAETFLPGFAERLDQRHDLILLSDPLTGPGEAEALSSADVVIGVRYAAGMPALTARLYQVPGAGYDGIDAEMVDMETWAVARACMVHGVPLAGLRGVSDGAAELHHIDGWTEYLHVIDARLAHAVDRLIAAL